MATLRHKIGAALLACSAVTGTLALGSSVDAHADSVTPTALTDFNPNTSTICPPDTSILKFVGGGTFAAGAHSDKSSGDPNDTATWTIDTAANTLNLTSVKLSGVTALVRAVVISNNGVNKAYQWSYGAGVVPTVGAPLVHTAPNSSVISPITGNQYFFVCAAPAATLTLNKVVQGGNATAADWTLTATGSTSFSGTAGVSRTVAAGTYALSESGPAGYSQLGWTCVNGVSTTTGSSVALSAGDSAVCTVTNSLPGIKVVKTSNAALLGGKPVVESATSVTYSYAVSLAAGTTVPLGTVSVADDKCAVVAGPVKTGGDADALLEVGETWTYTCASSLTATTTNTATASAITADNITVTDTDSLTVNVIHPKLALAKTTATPVVLTGTTVTFTITVTNSGDSTITGIAITDSKAPGCANNAVGTLAAGASVNYTCTMLITGQTVNVATASGTDPLGNPVTAEGTQQVDVSDPAITITKSVSPKVVRAGDTVTYTITVTNSGTANLTNVTVTDLAVPACDKAVGALVSKAFSSYTCTAVAGTAGVTNVAKVTATAPEGPPVSAEASASYSVVHPSISIVKSTSTPVVRKGSTVTFTLTVTNTGDVPLTNVTVGDPLVPGCAKVIGTLAPGAIDTSACDTTVNAAMLNTASVTGQPAVGAPVSAEDTEAVAVIDPAISITKTAATPTVASGGFVTFSITVVNSGDSTLTNVTVADPLTGSCARVIGTLTAGASVTYPCTTDALTASFTNVATVTGIPAIGAAVTATANASVTVSVPEATTTTTTPTTTTTTTTPTTTSTSTTTTTTTTTTPTTTMTTQLVAVPPAVPLVPVTPAAIPAPTTTAASTTVPPTTVAPTTAAPIANVAGVTVLPAAPVAKVGGVTETAPSIAFTGSRSGLLLALAFAFGAAGLLLLVLSKPTPSGRHRP